jgi:hypothetical protein
MDISGTIVSNKNDCVKISVIDISKHKRVITIDCKLENISEKPLWICIDNYSGLERYFEIEVDENVGKVIIKMESIIVPPGIYLEIPILSEYKKILPKNSVDFKFDLQFPISEDLCFKSKCIKVSFKDLRLIKIVIGYYEKDLSKLEKKYINISKNDVVLIDCFWVQENPENVISIEINKEIIEKKIEKE